MIPKWWIHVIIHLSKSTEYTTPRVNRNGNRGLGGKQCVDVGSSIVTNGPSLEGDVDNGGGYPRVKEGVYGKSLYFPHGFAMNLKCSKEEKKKKKQSLPQVP